MAVPSLVISKVAVAEPPTLALPALAVTAERVISGAVPVPDRLTVTEGSSLSSLATVTVAPCAPEASGLKVTVTVWVWAGVRVTDAGLTVKTALSLEMLLTTRLAVPLLVISKVAVAEPPTMALPAAAVAAEKVISGATATTPLPVVATVSDGSSASSLATVTVALLLAPFAGLKVTVTN